MFAAKGVPARGIRHLIPYFERAGFIDIEVIDKDIDLGGWRHGTFLLTSWFMRLDPKTAAAGRAARKAFGDAWNVLAERLEEYIPDEEERKVFGEKAREEMISGRYRLTIQMYEAEIVFPLTLSREMLIARKPKKT